MSILKATTSTNSFSSFLNKEVDEADFASMYSIPFNAKEPQDWVDQVNKLSDFWKRVDASFFPIPQSGKIVIINDPMAISNWNYAWINFLLSVGVEIYSAMQVVTWENGKKVISYTPYEYKYNNYYNEFGELNRDHVIPFTPYNPEDWDANDPEAPLPVYLPGMGEFIIGNIACVMGLLSDEELEELFFITHPKLTKEGKEIMFPMDGGGFCINFEEGYLALAKGGGKKFQAVQVITIGDKVSTGKVGLWLLADQLSKTAQYSIKGIINSLPNLWVEDNGYGVETVNTDPCKAIPHKIQNPVTVTPSYLRVFPWNYLAPLKKGINYKAARALYDAVGVIIADKQFGSYYAGKSAANAALIGVDGEWINTLHDADKLSKRWNRPMQSRKFLKAEQYTDSTFSESCRAQANLVSVTADGEEIRQWGRKMVTLISNSGLTRGSGVCLISEDTHFYTGVKKTLEGRVSLTEVSDAFIPHLEKIGKLTNDSHHAFNGLMAHVDNCVSKIDKDKFFEFGEVILDIKPIPKDIIVHNLYNQKVRVLGGRVCPPINGGVGYSPTYFNVELDIEVVAETQLVKGRGDGIKLTTLPEWFRVLDESLNEVHLNIGGRPLEMILNNEVIKGKIVQVNAFCQADDTLKYYDANSGLLTTDDGIIDLTVAPCKVHDWVETNAHTYYIEQEIAKYEWDKIVKGGFLTDCEVIEEFPSYVVVREKVQGLLTELLMEVEISTAEEAVGNSPMTPEMVAGISSQSKKLAEFLVQESLEGQAAVRNLVNMISMTKAMELDNTVDLSLPSDRAELIQALDAQPKVGLGKISDSKVLDKYKKLFKGGVYFLANNGTSDLQMFLDFNIIRSTMVWISGSADQISQEIVGFLRLLANPPESHVDSIIFAAMSKLISSLRGWLRKAYSSKGVLKRAARTAKVLVNGKFRASYAPALNPDADGLPKIGLHPDCQMVKLLAKNSLGVYHKKYTKTVLVGPVAEGATAIDLPQDFALPKHCTEVNRIIKDDNVYVIYFDPFTLMGEFASAFRIPMFMGLASKLVISSNFAKSHAFILPNYWSRMNEGDSDGDGISLLNCGIRGMMLGDMTAMNAAMTGFMGYSFVYGNKVSSWPYAEFHEKPMKKFLKWENEADKAKFGKPYVSKIPRETYFDAKGNEVIGYFDSGVMVQQHYRSAVGIAYGIASVLTFKLCEESYKNVDTSIYSLAVVIAWRTLYEGLGLAGYSPAAKKWFDILNACTKTGFYVITADGRYISSKSKEVKPGDKKLSGAHSLLFLGNEEDETTGKGLSHCWMNSPDPKKMYMTMLTVMNTVIWANRVRSEFSVIERGTPASKYVKNIEETLIFCALRRMGQGFDPAGLPMLEAIQETMEPDYVPDEDAINPQSSFMALYGTQAHMSLHCTWMRNLLINGVEIHNNVSRFLHDENVAEMNAMDDGYSD